MEPDQFAALRTDDGRELLAALTPYDPSTAMAVATRLRRAHPPELVTAAMSQAHLRTRALERFGSLGAELWWTRDGLEQASRPAVARWHAQLLVDAGATKVADLGCGVGIDTLAFAGAGMQVVAVERDPLTAAVARANTEERAVAHLVEVVTADADEVELDAFGCDALYMDPARRVDGRRITDPERWSPPLSTAVQRAGSVRAGLIKAAPGLDRQLRPADAGFDAVSIDGDLVEITLRLGAAFGGKEPFRAVLLPDGPVMAGDGRSTPRIAEWGTWVLEPNDAVIRSGLINDLADEIGAALVDQHVAYLTCVDEPPADPRYARFAVDEVLPFSVKKLRAAMRARDVGRVEIKKRAFAVDPEQLRRDLKLNKGATNACTVLLTRIGDAPVAVIAQRR